MIIPYFHLHINNDLCYQIKISLYQLFLSPIHHLPKTKMNLWFVRINLSMKSLTIYQIWIKKNSWNQNTPDYYKKKLVKSKGNLPGLNSSTVVMMTKLICFWIIKKNSWNQSSPLWGKSVTKMAIGGTE